MRSGVATAVGANTGSICYGLLTAFGVSVALQRWPMVWVVLRVGRHRVPGVARVSIAAPARGPTAADAARGATPAPPVMARSVREGFVTNMLNPSLATFYLLILPQFIPRDAPLAASALTLTAFHVALALDVAPDVGGRRRHAGGTLARTTPRRVLEGDQRRLRCWLALRSLSFRSKLATSLA